jgi:hypothetical protein
MKQGFYFDMQTRLPLHLNQAKCDTAGCKQKKWWCGLCVEWLDDSSGVGRRETHLRKKHAGQEIHGCADLDLHLSSIDGAFSSIDGAFTNIGDQVEADQICVAISQEEQETLEEALQAKYGEVAQASPSFHSQCGEEELPNYHEMWSEKNEFCPIQKERPQEICDNNTNVLAQDVFDGSIKVLTRKPRTFSEDELSALTSQFLEMDFETTMQVRNKLRAWMAVLVKHRKQNGSPDSVAMALESASDISGQKSRSDSSFGSKV